MNKKTLLSFVSLLLISAMAYLPMIWRVGYMNDDWYLMYSVGAYGPSAFVNIFSVDRPARALVMIPAHYLFGDNPLYYNLSAYLFRLVSALVFLWLLRMLFPEHNKATLLGSLLFLVYPGFLSQTNGIDYQSHVLALAAAHLSIALTIKAVLVDEPASKAMWHVLSVLIGLIYLSQMEWYIGFELFRWGAIFLLSWRRDGSLIRKAWRAICWAYPAFAIPIIFLIWRLFFFQSERGATDVDLQLAQVWSYPLQSVYHWSIQILGDLFDVMVAAWVVPFSQLKGFIQPWGVMGAVFAVVVALFTIQFLEGKSFQQEDPHPVFISEALILGLFIAISGLIPIAMVNRDVVFPAFSRYSLVSSAGVALLFSALLVNIKWRHVGKGIIAILMLVSLLIHHANTVKAAQQTALTKTFWWQVSWRIPQLAKNTTLIASYPGVPLEEDYFIWGPANLIYYPEKQNPENIQPGVYAVLLNKDTVEKVHARERQVYDKRKTITTYANYRNILVMTQPGVNSCVHIIDGMRPEYSLGEWDYVRDVGPYSEIEHVLANEAPHTPPTVVFGPEPDRGWCYFYQKADLARQRGEWEKVLEIGRQAFGQGFEPKDPIEWIPFLQAYSITGDISRLTELAPVVIIEPYVSAQICQILVATPGLSGDVQKVIDSLYCAE